VKGGKIPYCRGVLAFMVPGSNFSFGLKEALIPKEDRKRFRGGNDKSKGEEFRKGGNLPCRLHSRKKVRQAFQITFLRPGFINVQGRGRNRKKENEKNS